MPVSNRNPHVRPIILIPARLAARRLPDKPLADIHGEPMIVHVWRRAMEADLGPVFVACCDEAVRDAVEAAGANAVMTTPDLPSGTDRIHEALGSIDPDGAHDVIINVQGDLPTLPPSDIRTAVDGLSANGADISTVAAIITSREETDAPHVVKAVVSMPEGARGGRAIYFTRVPAPSGEGALLHHIGLYVYTRAALDRFVALPPSPLEQRERLEQLRALENGMTIQCSLVDSVPLGVDTQADLEAARRMLAP